MQPDAAAAHPPAHQSLNLTSYIASLAPETRAQLYGSPWTCQAVFRALEPLAQQYALRLLYTPDPLPDGAGAWRQRVPRDGMPHRRERGRPAADWVMGLRGWVCATHRPRRAKVCNRVPGSLPRPRRLCAQLGQDRHHVAQEARGGAEAAASAVAAGQRRPRVRGTGAQRLQRGSLAVAGWHDLWRHSCSRAWGKLP